ncbi:MAG: hypothetical protein WB801_02860, partial [Candidatus Dormiibacterota bacterium]
FTTRRVLATREFKRYTELLSQAGYDIHRMDPDNPPPPARDGVPTIYVGTLQDAHFTWLKTGLVPGEKPGGGTRLFANIDEIDEGVVHDNLRFVISEGVERPASAELAAQVHWAGQFLTRNLHSGGLTEAHFGRTPGQKPGEGLPAGLTTEGVAKAAQLAAQPLTEAEVHRLNMAAAARWDYLYRTHYTIHEGQVVLLNPVTDEVLYDPVTATRSRWHGGLAQAIEARHGLTIHADPVTSKQVTVGQLFALPVYRRVVGASGTALGKGTQFARQGLPRHITAIPRYYHLRGSFDTDYVTPTAEAKLDAITRHTHDTQAHGTRQPQLIILPNRLVPRLSEKLAAAGVNHTAIDANWFLDQGTRREEAFEDAVAHAGETGHVLVINQQGGRGLDIPITSDARKAGGLYVRIGAHSDVPGDDNQKENRTRRNGDPGGGRYYPSLDDPILSHPRAEITITRYNQAYHAYHAQPTSPTTRRALRIAEQTIRSLIPRLQAQAAQRLGIYLPPPPATTPPA